MLCFGSRLASANKQSGSLCYICRLHACTRSRIYDTTALMARPATVQSQPSKRKTDERYSRSLHGYL